jgi:uncharacterized cupin superfamily protein
MKAVNEGKAAVILDNPSQIAREDMVDWGEVARPIGEPVSSECGRLMFRRQDGSSEMGMWECTPGRWRCEVEKDEFCYFLAGEAVYTSDTGEKLTVKAGMAAAFPAGWNGECQVVETVRKVYMVR